MNVICIVQARTGSTRLPGKVLADLGGRPMLQFMLERLERLRVDQLVVATTELARDDDVARLAAAAGVAVVRGPESDVLARFAKTLDEYPAASVVRLTGDCPLADPELVEAVVDLHQGRRADYTSNVHPRTFPQGLDVEVMRAEALSTAAAEARDADEREHVTPFLYRRPERFRLANLRNGEPLGKERWTVDTPDDLEFVRRLVARMGRVDFGWRQVLASVGRTASVADGSVQLRPALSDDEDALFAWRNDPSAVRFSRSQEEVSRDEHRRWYRARIDDPGTQLHVAELDGRAVGVVRVDVCAGEGVVSIAVAPEARGRGIGTAALRALLQLLADDFQVVSLRAEVRRENRASMRAFASAGFRRSADDGDFAVWSWGPTWSTPDGDGGTSPRSVAPIRRGPDTED